MNIKIKMSVLLIIMGWLLIVIGTFILGLKQISDGAGIMIIGTVFIIIGKFSCILEDIKSEIKNTNEILKGIKKGGD